MPSDPQTPAGPGASSAVRVTVVLPVHDTREYLPDALASLDRQDLGPGELQVVAVDDGSTDGSGELLDEWARDRPATTVLHQENSGWPGQPRNRGLALATGTYVFFLDSDDLLADGALRQLADFADEHGSDVVLPRVRHVESDLSLVDPDSERPLGTRVADADLYGVFFTLMPQKLIRRALLLEHDLRFPEGVVRLEDGILMSQAYLLASRVSSVADRDYYLKRERAVGQNISAGHLDPVGYTGSVRTIGRNVRRLCGDEALADRIVLALYKRKGLKVFAPDRFLRYTPERRAEWVHAVAALAEDLVPVALEDQLDEPFRARSRMARAGDVAGLTTHATLLADSAPSLPLPLRGRLLQQAGVGRPSLTASPLARLQVELRRAEAVPEGLLVEGRVRVRGLPPAHLQVVVVLTPRAADAPVLELPAQGRRLDELGWQKWQVVLTPQQAAALPPGRYDAQLRTRGRELEAEVPVGEGRLGRVLALPGGDRFQPYRTRAGRLALRRLVPE